MKRKQRRLRLRRIHARQKACSRRYRDAARAQILRCQAATRAERLRQEDEASLDQRIAMLLEHERKQVRERRRQLLPMSVAYLIGLVVLALGICGVSPFNALLSLEHVRDSSLIVGVVFGVVFPIAGLVVSESGKALWRACRQRTQMVCAV
jgi:hypothetical protein